MDDTVVTAACMVRSPDYCDGYLGRRRDRPLTFCGEGRGQAARHEAHGVDELVLPGPGKQDFQNRDAADPECTLYV